MNNWSKTMNNDELKRLITSVKTEHYYHGYVRKGVADALREFLEVRYASDAVESRPLNNDELKRLITSVETGNENHYHGDARRSVVDALKELLESREKLAEIKDCLRR